MAVWGWRRRGIVWRQCSVGQIFTYDRDPKREPKVEVGGGPIGVSQMSVPVGGWPHDGNIHRLPCAASQARVVESVLASLVY